MRLKESDLVYLSPKYRGMIPAKVKKERARPVHHEANLQIQCVEWFYLQFPQHRVVHIPNEGKRAAFSGHFLKRMGMSAGVLDFLIPVARMGFHGFWIEFKKDEKEVRRVLASKRKEDLEQLGWMEYLRAQGNKVEMIGSFERFTGEVARYMRG